MSNPWEEVGVIEPELKSPSELVRELFQPLPEITNSKVAFKIQKVNFFPEEVVYSTVATELSQLYASTSFAEKKVLPHPEFGYNPESAKAKESFRFRFLLIPSKVKDFQVELFKFKFPITFYPVQFYIEQTDFPELSSLVQNNGIVASNQDELIYVVGMVIKSQATLNLIKRLMAL
jgi:hypothetical protein